METRRLPDHPLAELVSGALVKTSPRALFGHGRALLIGVPGAFTPVCHTRHLPDLVASADRLVLSGFQFIGCITPNDPWVNREWSQQLDPEGKVRILSDGNLLFGRSLSLTTPVEALHLGARLKRFLMIVREGVIERLQVEGVVTDLNCTLVSKDSALIDAASPSPAAA